MANRLHRYILQSMLSYLTKTMRSKAAIFLAVLYACTVLAPHAAMAFGPAEGMAHCLTVDGTSNMHDHGQSTHQHADGTTHTHGVASQGHDESGNSSNHSDEKGPSAACCGLFSCSAMVVDVRVVAPGPVTVSAILPLKPGLVAGEGPSRINRPPIA